MEHHLESMIFVGPITQLPKSSAILDQHCELFKTRRITGILLCNGEHFMAVIEGQPLVLQAAIKQNIKDPNKVHTIHKVSIPERGYRHWNIHIGEQNEQKQEIDILIANLIAKVNLENESISTFEKIKNLVAYFYCEYIVNSYSCEDYRMAKIA